MRSRPVALLCAVGAVGLIAGCGGGSVAYDLPRTTPVLTAPPSGGTTTPADTATTSTTSTTTTSTTPTATPGTSGTGGTAVTPPATATPDTSGTGGTSTPPAQTTPAAPTDPGASGGADFNAFCEENPGAC